jgi:4-amino-4-deoxy-L-arabinose transferase-like glycosyltransferase
MLVALVTCFHGLANKSLWLDEAFSVTLARLDWTSMWRVIVQDQTNMMLYHMVLHFWLRLGSSEFVARAASAVFAVASIVPLYLLGRRLLGERQAAMAALLLAVNSFFVRFAQEARGYSLLLLLTTTASYLFLVALDDPSFKRWSGYILVSALSIYVHFFGALVVAAHVLSGLLSSRRRTSLLKLVPVNALIVLAITPLVWLAWGTRHLEWVTRPSLLDVRRLFGALSGGGRALLWTYFVTCLIAVATVLVRPHASRRQWWGRVFLLSWLLVPVTAVFLVSITLKPMFSDRYFIMMLPPLLLLVAAGIETLPRTWLRVTAFGGMMALGIRGLLAWYAAPPAEDWRGASAYVLGAATAGDMVAFEAPYVRIPFEYYLRLSSAESSAPKPLYPTAPWGSLGILDPEISRGVNDWPIRGMRQHRLWVVQSHILPPVPADEARLRVPATIRERYKVVDERTFRGIRVLLYLAQDTPR